MRIVVWNCQMGFAKKIDALLSQNPDVAVVPECSEASAIVLRQHGYGILWTGSNPRKGMGVFCRHGWSMRALPLSRQKWVVPVEIEGPTPFTLLAIWACKSGTRREENYIGQVYKALVAHPEWFNHCPVVLAGDFNSNKIWDPERVIGNHSDVVKMLAEHGLVSAYHEFFSEPQGLESRATIHLHRHADKPYHIDYIFIPREWALRLRTVEVGKYDEWTRLSDHSPIMIELLFQPSIPTSDPSSPRIR